MEVLLGKTKIKVNKNGFGALPIQRISFDESKQLLQKAYDAGIRFYDTARFYTDSEEKMGSALSNVRDQIIIATKTMAKNTDDFWNDLHTSLLLLKTNHIDVYQFHNPPICPKPNDGSGLYEAMLQAKEKGLIKHIGITSHRYDVAKEAVLSGLYETLQFPFSYIHGTQEKELVGLCEENDVGFIAMKGLSGGLITNAKAAFAFLAQFDHVLPIWGIQKQEELDEFLVLEKQNPSMDQQILEHIKKDKEELGKEFCRGCGYCLPCPVNIEIPTAARMSLMLRRAPVSAYTTEKWVEKMKNIKNCTHCNQCKKRCPYDLDTPKLLEENLKDYLQYVD